MHPAQKAVLEGVAMTEVETRPTPPHCLANARTQSLRRNAVAICPCAGRMAGATSLHRRSSFYLSDAGRRQIWSTPHPRLWSVLYPLHRQRVIRRACGDSRNALETLLVKGIRTHRTSQGGSGGVLDGPYGPTARPVPAVAERHPGIQSRDRWHLSPSPVQFGAA